MRFALTLAAGLAAGSVAAVSARADVDIQEVTSPSGITAWLVEDHSIPFTALEIRFRGGTSLDAPDSRGAVYLMTGLLEEGAADRDARDFARAREELAASFQYDSSDDDVSVSARFLTENRDEAIDLLRTSIVEPRFDQDAVDRVRGQVLSGLQSDAKDPDDIASNAFSEFVFGDHPYGSSGKGTLDSVAALTRDDVVAAHKAVFARDRVYVGAVGDITPEELGEIVDELLADLPETGAPLPGPAELHVEGGTTVIPFETPQSVALFGQPGLERDDPDFFAAMIATHILGGTGESRLMEEVRVKRGLTYGVYAYLGPKDQAAILVGRVGSANDRIAEAIEVIRDEWAKLAEDGVTEEELEAAKTYLTGAYPLRFKGNGRIAGILVGMQMEDLPIDYIATRNDKVNAVTLEDVNRVAAELYRPEDLRFVVVGTPEGLDPDTN
ncbi:zinc protease [Marinibacterium profundimaris]|uniref:Zinc protease n=1 Tax=Marinibacterium profundimaris TaxID=1679460 RepID=A0A225NTT3_9RHOB|nr:zinc protease [Marinibacterium profundimaris]